MSELLTELRHELAPVEESIRRHRYLDQLEAGRVPERSLQAFAGEQHAIISSDRRSFEHVASRLASSAAAGFFAQIAAGEAVALGHLLGFARSLGLDEQALRAYEPQSGCQACPAYVAWLALNGSPGDVALADPGQPRRLGRELCANGGGAARPLRRRLLRLLRRAGAGLRRAGARARRGRPARERPPRRAAAAGL